MALSNFNENNVTITDGVTIIAALNDEPISTATPTPSGYVADSAALKAKFDEGVSKLKTWINGTLIPFINKKANQFHDTVTIASTDWGVTYYQLTDPVYKTVKTLTYSGASAPWVESGVCVVAPKPTVADVAKTDGCNIYCNAVAVRSGTWGKSSYNATVTLTFYTTTQLDESVDLDVVILF